MTAVIERTASTAQPPVAPTPPERRRLARLVLGPQSDPASARPLLLILLAATGLLYAWNLAASGYGNDFYAAAVQAGTKSWKAWFFGSLDAGNSITVDKPPAALWVDVLSARLFGFTSWSLLLPQALEGVAAVGLLYGAVRRLAGPRAGLLAGSILALTPVAVLMFRFDNPDALLTLLLVAAGYAVVRSLEAASTRWLAWAGVALGFAFLTKMLQGFLVLPAFALVYLIAAPTGLGRRIRQVLLAGLAMVVAAGWWVAAVAVWPADARPYIGGSTNNSVLDLVFGYNGLGRLFGASGGAGGNGGGFGGTTGLLRLFNSQNAAEISFLLPAAVVALVAGLWVTRRAPRTDLTRAGLVLFGGWLVITALVFSYMQGTMHPYYSIALAPALGGVIGLAAVALWQRRRQLDARLGLAATTASAAGWSYEVLGRSASWHPELRVVIATLGAIAVLGLVLPPARLGRLAMVVPAAAIIAGMLGSASFALATAASPHTGDQPTAGPAVVSTSAGRGGFGGQPSGSMPSGMTMPGGVPTGSAATGSGSTGSSTGTSTAPSGAMTGSSTSTSSALVTALKATTSTWSAATVGAQNADSLELASGTSIMAIGGWGGSDNSITLAQFEADVAAGKIHYFLAGGSGGGAGGSTASATGATAGSAITSWVKAHYTATTIGGQTVYDLTNPTS